MAWVTPTTDDLAAVLSSVESRVLSSFIAAGQADPAPAALENAVREVRGYIIAKRRVAAGLTVPEELLRATLTIARHTLISRLPDERLRTEARTSDYQDAIALMRRVASGEYGFEEAESGATQAAPASSTIVSKSTGYRRKDVRF